MTIYQGELKRRLREQGYDTVYDEQAEKLKIYQNGIFLCEQGKNGKLVYTLVLTDALGNKEVITFRIIQPKVQEFTHNFDDIEGFGGVLVNGEDKRLNYGTLELFDDGVYEVGVIVSGKTYTFNVTVDGTAPTLKLNGVENGGITKDGVKLTNVSETAELKVFKDGKEIKYKLGDEITEVGKYKATVTDECGNQTTYEFEIEKSVNGWLIAFIIIGVLVLAGGVTVFILKKKEII